MKTLSVQTDEQSALRLWCSHMSYDMLLHDLAYTEFGIPTQISHISA